MAATMEQRLETNPGQNSSLDSYFLRLSLNNASSSNPHHNLHNNLHNNSHHISSSSHLSHHHQSLQQQQDSSNSDFQAPLIQITPSSSSAGGANNTPANNSGNLSPTSSLCPPSNNYSKASYHLLQVPSAELGDRSNCTFLQVPQQDLSKLAVMPQD